MSSCNLFPGFFLPWANQNSGLGSSGWQDLGSLRLGGGVSVSAGHEAMDLAVYQDGRTLTVAYIDNDKTQAHVQTYVNGVWEHSSSNGISFANTMEGVSADFIYSNNMVMPIASFSIPAQTRVLTCYYQFLNVYYVDNFHSRYGKTFDDGTGQLAMLAISNAGGGEIQYFPEFYNIWNVGYVPPYGNPVYKMIISENRDNTGLSCAGFLSPGGLELGAIQGGYASISNNSSLFYGTNTLGYVMTGGMLPGWVTNYLAYVDGFSNYLHVSVITTNVAMLSTRGEYLHHFPYYQIRALDLAYDYHSRRLYLAVVDSEGFVSLQRFDSWQGNLQAPVQVGGTIPADGHEVDIEIVGDLIHTIYLAYTDRSTGNVEIRKIQDN